MPNSLKMAKNTSSGRWMKFMYFTLSKYKRKHYLCNKIDIKIEKVFE